MSQHNYTNPLTMMSMYGSQYLSNSRTNTATVENDEINTLLIYNAITGAKIKAPVTIFNKLDTLKHYISQAFKIDVVNLFILTPFGIKLKFNMLLHEQARIIYAFDRKFFSPLIVDSLDGPSYEKDPDNNKLVKDLLSSVINNDMVNMIKPRESPLLGMHMSSWVNKLSTSIETNREHVNSSDLDFDGLRLILNSLKRNSGWASALLSDFKGIIYNESNENIEDIENILESLSVLIQYVDLLFKGLEKDFNNYIDKFIILSQNSLAQKWFTYYKNLQGLTFTLKNKENTKLNPLVLANLIHEEELKLCAKQANSMKYLINKNLVIVRKLIEEDIVIQIKAIADAHEKYKQLYMKSSGKNNSQEENIKGKQLFEKLQKEVDQLNNETKEIPSFAELIVTVNSNSSTLAPKSVSKILHLIDTYQVQISTRVPNITDLVNSLYNIQLTGFTDKEDLQKNIIASFYVLIVKIQLSIREVNKKIQEDIARPINELKNLELKLSVVLDLPLMFGIWIIAILGNLKNGMSIDKLIKKSSEILEMLSYVESLNQSKWLEGFIDNIGKDKLDVLGLNNTDFRTEFTKGFYHKTQFKLIQSSESAPVNKTTDVKKLYNESRPNERRKSSFETNYLQPFNKIIHNINVNKFNQPRSREASESSPDTNGPLSYTENETKHTVLSDLDKSNYAFYRLIFQNITLEDVLIYIKDLQTQNFGTEIVNQLKNYIKKLGVDKITDDPMIKTNDPSYEKGNEMIIKKGDVNGFGTFDVADGMYMKLFKKFVREFQIEGINIDIKPDKQEGNEAASVDSIDEVVKGYELRIKKLENLLHERRFEEFQNRWGKRLPTSNLEINAENIGIDNEFFDYTAELGKQVSLPESHHAVQLEKLKKSNKILTEKLNAIKEKDNFKENVELNSQVSSQADEIKDLKKQLDHLKLQVKSRDEVIASLKVDLKASKDDNEKYKTADTNSQTELEELKSINKDLIENLSYKETELTREHELNQKEKNSLKQQFEDAVDKVILMTDLNNKMIHELKVTNELFGRFENLITSIITYSKGLSSDLYNNLKLICLVLESMGLLLVKNSQAHLHDSTTNESFMDDTTEYGLEQSSIFIPKDGFAIIRVKGLRNKKKEKLSSNKEKLQNAAGAADTMHEIIADEIVKECQRRLEWIPDSAEVTFSSVDDSMLSLEEYHNDASDEQIEKRIKDAEEFIDSIHLRSNEVKKWIDKFDLKSIDLKYNLFKSLTSLGDSLIVQKVHKRFDDVESLARKLTKEKAQLKLDIKELRSSLKNRLVLRSFKIGDLVLFLKTFVSVGSLKRPKTITAAVDSDASYSLEDSDISMDAFESLPSSTDNDIKIRQSYGTKQPWAIFNITSPNYFLKNQNSASLRGRDWFVGRITELEPHVVTNENANDIAENPFKLGVGTKWYFVVTNEEKIIG